MPTRHEPISMHVASPEKVESSLISPDMNMLIMTWVVFFLLLGVLYKFAWRPILQLLDAREESIRKSLEDADRIKAEMEHLDQKCAQIVSGAQAQASVIIDQSRKTARNAAQIIENKAREEAKIALENTIRDIKEETQSAQARLRKESANIAVELAGKIIEENMSTEKNRALINKYIEKI